MQTQYDVIIAGAGPVGLMLASELRLSDVSVVILEQEGRPEASWKAAPMGFRGLNTASVELLYRRGLLDDADFRPNRSKSVFTKTPGFQNAGHFAGIELDANLLDLSKHKYRVAGPALQNGFTTIERIEKVLTKRAEQSGAIIIRNCGFSKILSQNNNSITIESTTAKQFTAKWLVGCDGGRSLVRKEGGFEFLGTEPKVSFYGIQADFDPPNILQDGCNIMQGGAYTLGPGPNVMYMAEFDSGAYDRRQEVSIPHLQGVLNRIRGRSDVTITALHSSKTFTDRSKQVTTYRKNRILLAGDAAHIHAPMGSQGLNAGLGDAANLGWKLASAIRQEQKLNLRGSSSSSSSSSSPLLDTSLLDSYTTERRPIGAWIMDWTRAQVEIMQPNAHGLAVRRMIEDLIATPDGTNYYIDLAWGLSQHYDMRSDGAHELLGCSAPEVEMVDGERLGLKLKDTRGKGLLVEFCSEEERDRGLEEMIGNGAAPADGVRHLAMKAKDDLGLKAILVRPDGVVVWAEDRGPELDVQAAGKAMRKWFSY